MKLATNTGIHHVHGAVFDIRHNDGKFIAFIFTLLRLQ